MMIPSQRNVLIQNQGADMHVHTISLLTISLRSRVVAPLSSFSPAGRITLFGDKSTNTDGDLPLRRSSDLEADLINIYR